MIRHLGIFRSDNFQIQLDYHSEVGFQGKILNDPQTPTEVIADFAKERFSERQLDKLANTLKAFSINVIKESNHFRIQFTPKGFGGGFLDKLFGKTKLLPFDEIKHKLDEQIRKDKEESEKGDTDAMLRLGDRYLNGTGVVINEKEAHRLYRFAADKGNLHGLGLCYYYGIDIVKDETKAVALYTHGSILENAHAKYNLGYCYENGRGVKKDEAESIELYTQAANLGHSKAMLKLGNCFYFGAGVKRDEAKAVKFYIQAANLGDAQAMRCLGHCYENGCGVKKNEARAVELYTQATNLGDADAMYNLSLCYKKGIGVQKDLKKAEICEKASETSRALDFSNNVPMQQNEEKKSSVRNKIQPSFLSSISNSPVSKPSANLEKVHAMFNLGNCYKYIEGETDIAKALEFYTQAARLGNAQAMWELGLCYEGGQVVQKDLKKAAICEKAGDGDQTAIDEMRAFLALDFPNNSPKQQNEEKDPFVQIKIQSSSPISEVVKQPVPAVPIRISSINLLLPFDEIKRRFDAQLKKDKEESEKGDTEAMIRLGRRYDFGQGVVKNEKKAHRLYREAADKGNTCGLGLCYDYGIGVEKDKAKALELYTKAANLGNVQAMVNLGTCFLNGAGVDENEAKGVELYTQAANLGHAMAMITLGIRYDEGEGVEKNEVKALELYIQAANLGNASAMFNLSHCYWDGKGVQKNEAKAMELLALAANLGNIYAMVTLGFRYEEGRGVQEDQKKAEICQKAHNGDLICQAEMRRFLALDFPNISISPKQQNEEKDPSVQFKIQPSFLSSSLASPISKPSIQNPVMLLQFFEIKRRFEAQLIKDREESEKGDSEAMIRLGYRYTNGQGVVENKKEARRLYRLAADKGNTCGLGLCYYFGIGVKEDKVKAFELYTQAANLGHVWAMVELGYCYSYGEGVQEKEEKAVDIYNQAAKLGHAAAMVVLGIINIHGRGVQKDKAKAVELYIQAANLGHVVALVELGLCYKNGQGVQMNEAKAFELFSQAASLGYARAMVSLGDCYKNGQGVQEDEAIAVKLYSQAAKLGDTNAMENLGSCYEDGEGVQEDQEKAEICQKASEGDENAQVDMLQFLALDFPSLDTIEMMLLPFGEIKRRFETQVIKDKEESEKGDPEAMLRLGYRYLNGEGVVKNEQEAHRFYRLSAEKDNTCSLGHCYYFGIGMKEDSAKAVELYTQAANLGDAGAMFSLGYCYEKGQGVQENDIKAVEYYTQAANLGHARAMFNLGYCYENGQGVQEDIAIAVVLYIQAANLGHAGAISSLSACYEKGQGVQENEAKALEFYAQAANLGDDFSIFELGRRYKYGQGVQKDLKKAEICEKAQKGDPICLAEMRHFLALDFPKIDPIQTMLLPFDEIKKRFKVQLIKDKKESEKGNSDAMLRLGYRYRYGEGVVYDRKETFRLYRLAADKGNTCGLGHCYYFGIGMKEDSAKAVELYTQAANLGHVQAMYSLGDCYENGTGVQKNEAKAVELYNQAAHLGDVQAMENLGECYENGTGVQKNKLMAIELYTQAANLGYAEAMFHLGRCYKRGDGVEEDEAKAIELYTQAANLSVARALRSLGECYENGTGVQKDEAKAVELYIQAAELGNAYAWINLGDCYKEGKGVQKDLKKAEICKKAYYDQTAHAEMLQFLALDFPNISPKQKNEEKDPSVQIKVQPSSLISKVAKQPETAVPSPISGSSIRLLPFDEIRWKLDVQLIKDKEESNWYSEAMLRLGDRYHKGDGVVYDWKEAHRLYRLAADRGNKCGLGLCYYFGIGVEEDKAKAVELYNQAANLRDANAMVNLGFCYSYGKGVNEDQAKAVELYTQATKLGNTQAMTNLGDCYKYSRGVQRNEVKAVEYYIQAANLGNTDAIFHIGNCYTFGFGVKKDELKAAELYIQAAIFGNACAMHKLADCFENGKGVQKDLKKAEICKKAFGSDRAAIDEMRRYLALDFPNFISKQKSEEKDPLVQVKVQPSSLSSEVDKKPVPAVALPLSVSSIKLLSSYGKAVDQVSKDKEESEKGDTDAMVRLGYRYANGQGVQENEAMAVRLYKRAANLGNAQAMTNLGNCYKDGQGVQKNEVKAVELYIQAAKLENSSAMSNLGWCYLNGRGVQKSEARGVEFYSLAANLGDVNAIRYLGLCYETGKGVQKDFNKAKICKKAYEGDQNAQAEMHQFLALDFPNISPKQKNEEKDPSVQVKVEPSSPISEVAKQPLPAISSTIAPIQLDDETLKALKVIPEELNKLNLSQKDLKQLKETFLHKSMMIL